MTKAKKPKLACHLGRHNLTNEIVVSGYGYSEYRIWFCKICPKIFGRMVRSPEGTKL